MDSPSSQARWLSNIIHCTLRNREKKLKKKKKKTDVPFQASGLNKGAYP